MIASNELKTAVEMIITSKCDGNWAGMVADVLINYLYDECDMYPKSALDNKLAAAVWIRNNY